MYRRQKHDEFDILGTWEVRYKIVAFLQGNNRQFMF